ncbi:kazal-type serine protease inhibitor domain-containing protein [Phthorimaea operculella]|nr:kazal-type serine protease inhibitor domain-containing protein [Phthorimaea operculella]
MMISNTVIKCFFIGLAAVTVGVLSNIAFPFRDTFPSPYDYGCFNCPRVYVPICGSDNRTYMNYCRMACLNTYYAPESGKRISMQFEGPCTMIDFVPTKIKPAGTSAGTQEKIKTVTFASVFKPLTVVTETSKIKRTKKCSKTT